MGRGKQAAPKKGGPKRAAEDEAPAAAAAPEPKKAKRGAAKAKAEPKPAAAAAEAKGKAKGKKKAPAQAEPEPEEASGEGADGDEDAELDAIESMLESNPQLGKALLRQVLGLGDDEDPDDEGEEGEGGSDDDEGGSEPGGVFEAFSLEMEALEQQHGKHCLILEQAQTDPEEDGEEVHLAELRRLRRVFVPEPVHERFKEIWEELAEIGCTDDEADEDEQEDGGEDIMAAIMKAMAGPMRALSTRHSADMHAVFNTRLDGVDKLIKAKKWAQAFVDWCATLMAASREKHWYEDTDLPDDASRVYGRLRTQWHKLRGQSEEKLGGLLAEEGQGDPKDALGAYLQAVATDMRETSDSFDVQDV